MKKQSITLELELELEEAKTTYKVDIYGKNTNKSGTDISCFRH
jgi:hypothetical protein